MIKVEVGQYRPVDKGALKAFFSLVIFPEGQKILDCRYFEMGDKKWWSMPQKEIKKENGQKSEYIPLVSYLDKKYAEEMKQAVLEAIKTHLQKAPDESKGNTVARQSTIQSESPELWF